MALTEDDARTGGLTARMAQVARELLEQPDPTQTYASAVALAVATVAGCDAATVTLTRRDGRVDTVALAGASAPVADRLQRELGEGPCLEAAQRGDVVRSDDLGHDPRWPVWGPQVSGAGVRSALCLRLFTHEGVLGALNLFSHRTAGFDEAALDEGSALAAHVAIAVVGAQRLHHLHVALEARTVTAQAMGIVMERYGVDEAQAFAVLTRVATTEQRKLRDIASELVATRRIPGVAHSADEGADGRR